MIGNPWGIEQLDIKLVRHVPIPGFEIDVLDESGNIFSKSVRINCDCYLCSWAILALES